MKTERKTGLVVLYNHNFEKNIPIIRSLYRERFSECRQLMPFYYGEEPDVIPVYGNSFQFHTYIAQSCETLLQQMHCDDFLIIGDDLLLNPLLNESNIHEQLQLEPGSFYLDGMVDVSSGECWRGMVEAAHFSPTPPGLDASANRLLPSQEEAYRILHERGVLASLRLSRYKPYIPSLKKPLLSHLSHNIHVLRAALHHWRKKLRYRVFPLKPSYPCVFGYSDMVLAPRERFKEWCRYLQIFATWRMFVELAIPTATLLLPGAKVQYAAAHAYKTGNVWYPQDPAHYDRIEGLIREMSERCQYKMADLPKSFPAEYLYLHPVKLSRFHE